MPMSPNTTIMMAITMAKIGRLMKIFPITFYFFAPRFVGLRFDTHTGAQFVEAVGNNLLTGLEAGIDHPHRSDTVCGPA